MSKKIHSQSYKITLTSALLNTPLGNMLAISDEHALYFLGFCTRREIETEIKQLCNTLHALIIPGTSNALESIQKELDAYFNGTLRTFKTPFTLTGTPFQKKCWNALQRIPYGQTQSYAMQAYAINNTSAHRAVGSANGKNTFAIIIPCHRVVNSNGKLGGYNGGIDRKQWLINFEKQNCN